MTSRALFKGQSVLYFLIYIIYNIFYYILIKYYNCVLYIIYNVLYITYITYNI